MYQKVLKVSFLLTIRKGRIRYFPMRKVQTRGELTKVYALLTLVAWILAANFCLVRDSLALDTSSANQSQHSCCPEKETRKAPPSIPCEAALCNQIALSTFSLDFLVIPALELVRSTLVPSLLKDCFTMHQVFSGYGPRNDLGPPNEEIFLSLTLSPNAPPARNLQHA